MAEADVDVVLRSIHNSSCVYLHQHLTTEGVDVVELATDVPEGWTFLRQLPEKVWKMEVWELIVLCFDHLSEAHAHMSSFVANISSLAKIADPKTFNMVMKAATQPMIQSQHPGALPESGPRSTPKDHCRRMPVPAGKSHPPPALISHTGTMVWTHQASSCSGLAPSQMQVFQWRHCQGSLHYV